MTKRLRLLLTQKCNRKCEGCCNKDWDLDALPVYDRTTPFEVYMITGGEPMLFVDELLECLTALPRTPGDQRILYTAHPQPLTAMPTVLMFLTGLTVTLHEPQDVQPFLDLNNYLLGMEALGQRWDLRLNVFKGVELPPGTNTSLWDVRKERVWIPECGLSEGEVFMRW